ALVDAGGLVGTTGETLENRLRHVVRIPTVEDLDVEVDEGVEGEGAQELLDEGEIELVADVGHALRRPVVEEGAPTEVEGDADEGFVHGEVTRGVAVEAPLFPEGAAEGL